MTDNAEVHLVNPVTGDEIWFERVPKGEDDEVVFRVKLPPGSPGTPLHLHPHSHEHFECVGGELRMTVGGRQVSLRAGEGVDVAPGVVHRFWNESSEPVVFRSSARPGLKFYRFLRIVYGLGIDRKVGPSGMPGNPLKLAVIREFADLYFAGVPVWIQRCFFGPLGALARLTGAHTRLGRYWT